MKEISIEEKARRYDEAIIRGSRLWESDMITRENYEYIFPEVKESEDVRIRKALIRFHKSTIDVDGIKGDDVLAWLEKQGNLMKALQISNAKIGELIEKNYYLKEQLEKQGENNMGISEATKQKLEDNLNKALKKETPESCNEFLDEQGEQKTTIEMITPEESLGIDSDTYNKIVDECVYGEQKPIKEHNACEFCEDRYGCVSPCSMKLIEEEKSADKVEPKFHEGDWVIGRATNNEPRQIAEIKEEGYKTTYGEWIGFSFEEDMRLWAIEDAKDGDVLVSESTCGLGTWYCIFKSLDGDESMTVYCYLARDGRFETKKELCFDKDPYNTKPATKEQRGQLEKAMTNAGYIFDFEKKELKKIIDEKQIKKNLQDNSFRRMFEQKPAWSEEDNRMCKAIIDNIQAICEEGYFVGNIDSDELIKWLKSLKERYTWKPSEEQMRVLDEVIRNPHLSTTEYSGLIGLREQLKKLRKE